MKKYIVHDAAGNILRSGMCLNEDLKHQVTFPNEFVIEWKPINDEQYIDDTKFYVDGHRIMPKQLLSFTQEGDVLKGLPKPCLLGLDGKEYYVVDGVAELSVNLHGRYKLTIKSAKYLDYTGEILL